MTTQAEDNLDRLVEVRERFDDIVRAQRGYTGDGRVPRAVVVLLVQLGRVLGVPEPDLAVFGAYEPPQMTVAGNMHDLLHQVCAPHVDSLGRSTEVTEAGVLAEYDRLAGLCGGVPDVPIEEVLGEQRSVFSGVDCPHAIQIAAFRRIDQAPDNFAEKVMTIIRAGR